MDGSWELLVVEVMARLPGLSTKRGAKTLPRDRDRERQFRNLGVAELRDMDLLWYQVATTSLILQKRATFELDVLRGVLFHTSSSV